MKSFLTGMAIGFFCISGLSGLSQSAWQSAWVTLHSDSTLTYATDSLGNCIPDFSAVGYRKNREPLPFVPVVITVQANAGDDQANIQKAIDRLSEMPVAPNGFRGAVLLQAGTYRIPGSLYIRTSGIVLRGEGEATILRATGKLQRSLLVVSGNGRWQPDSSRRMKIIDPYVPVGAKAFRVDGIRKVKVGDSVLLQRPATENWIADLQMNKIAVLDSQTRQWSPGEYTLSYERVITAIRGDSLYLDNPVVMRMDQQYGGGWVVPYQFPGRIENVAVEDLVCESDYESEQDEAHGWIAVYMDRAINGWARKVVSRHFGYACVSLGSFSRNITVTECISESPKSRITGGRRYSFNNDGQLNLVMHCKAIDGRHDFVTGARVCGPNVFFDCVAVHVHAGIGPHHRWSTGTLYDNIISDGAINVQDRGNWGTGHGWAGANQVIWNCKAATATVQNPWVSASNFIIGFVGKQTPGRLPGRPPGIWEGQNKPGLQPASLYLAQLQQSRAAN